MMGLFRKDSPAEKKLKELTGGFALSSNFRQKLKDNDIGINEGVKIQKQLKDEIKQGKVNENNLQSRLNQLIGEYSNVPADFKTCPECGEVQDAEYTFCINCGHDLTKTEVQNNQITCPVCAEKQDDSHTFCINCGNDLTKRDVSPKEVTCPICGKKQYETSTHCLDCGYDFINRRVKPKKKKCPNCNRELFASTMFCPHCNYDFKTAKVHERKKKPALHKTKKQPVVHEAKPTAEFEDFRRKTQFLNNYDFNMKTCPDCNTKFLKADPFCFNCGTSVVDHETVMNDSVEFKNGKLVQKEEVQDDELSDLEALYSQTVKSKYAPLFKIAYVLYLDSFDKNPSKKSVDKLARNYDTTHNKLKKQALEDGFIEPAPAICEARKTKVSDLKEILKEHNLKVSGKKDELIERLDENLSEDELKKYFKSKNYQLSPEGAEFLAKNAPTLYVFKSKELERVLLTYDLGKIFEEKVYTENEIYDKLLSYLKRILDEKLNHEVLIDFKSTSNAIAKVQEDKGDLMDALETRLKVFLFDINNYSSYADRAEPGRTNLKKKDFAALVNLMHELTLPIDELKAVFEKAYDGVIFKCVVTKKDSLIYLLKIFGGEDLDNVSKEINENYANPY